MTAMPSTYVYQVGGSLDSDAPSYVKRQADVAFYQALKIGQFCYVLNSRQMGKSSLRVRTMKRLEAEGIICVCIDLTCLGSQNVTPETWYAGIFYTLVNGGQLISKFEWRTWWKKQREMFSPVQCLSLFIEEILLVEIKQNIAIFIDEIDYVLSQSFSLDDLFRLIRYCYERRNTHSDYKRLTFALLGVASPSDLIRDKKQTPFNIGQAIQLSGFSFAEVQPLMEGLKGTIEYPEAVIREILDWTGGQPFLTQKLCHLVVKSQSLLFDATSPITTLPTIEQIVRNQIVKNWVVQDEPQHLKTIRDRILKNEEKAVQLLGLYQKIWQQGEIPADGSAEQMELRMSGLVVEKQGHLKIHNPIYEAVFDQNWLEQQLEQLRPYASAIAAWSASERQDTLYLLQGVELQKALTWGLGKCLSEEDYQFLVASQDVAKQQTQHLLDVTEQASHLLASARAIAKQTILKRRTECKWIPLTALGVTIPLLLLRFSGLLQGLEWHGFDRFLRWRPLEPPDERVVIVTIDETDLAQVGQWPIPDRILAQALSRIKAAQPQAIGLDLYRDLPVEPGHRDLVQLFQSTPYLFGIEKAIGMTIAPSPYLNQRQQIGFADLVVDGDGKVRRALLSMILADDEIRYSFAVKLALHYLEVHNITLESLDQQGQRVRLGKADFERFTGNDGGYVRTQSGGYQILLNFRGTEPNFRTFSLREILNNPISPDDFRDRLVLIGTTAESINDLFYTPYSSPFLNSPAMMPGIVIQANIASQLLSAALDGRPLLRVLPDFWEGLWILVMAAVGASISWRFKSLKAILIVSLGISGGLVGGCYLAFIEGWWLPVMPSLIALLGGTTILLLITNKQRDQLQFHLTLDALLEAYRDDEQIGRMALEYLKQSETPENKAFIEKELLK